MVPPETLHFYFGSLSTMSIVMTDTMYLPKIMFLLFWDTRYVLQKKSSTQKICEIKFPVHRHLIHEDSPKGNDYRSHCLYAHLRGPGAQRYEIFFWLPP